MLIRTVHSFTLFHLLIIISLIDCGRTFPNRERSQANSGAERLRQNIERSAQAEAKTERSFAKDELLRTLGYEKEMKSRSIGRLTLPSHWEINVHSVSFVSAQEKPPTFEGYWYEVLLTLTVLNKENIPLPCLEWSFELPTRKVKTSAIYYRADDDVYKVMNESCETSLDTYVPLGELFIVAYVKIPNSLSFDYLSKLIIKGWTSTTQNQSKGGTHQLSLELNRKAR